MLRILLLTTALASGGVAAWMAGAGQPAEVMAADGSAGAVAVRLTEVLVASVEVPQGESLTAEHVRWREWPADAVTSSYFVRSEQPEAIAELSGSIARARLIAGAPLLKDSVAPEKSNYLAAVLAPGMRAVAIRISAEKTAGGFILPNDRVDVLLAMSCQPQDGCESGMMVRTILRNIRVLAIDQSGGEDGGSGVLVGKTATLELTPRQTESIIGAEASGTLSLVLRPATEGAEQVEAGPVQAPTVRVTRGGVSEYVTLR